MIQKHQPTPGGDIRNEEVTEMKIMKIIRRSGKVEVYEHRIMLPIMYFYRSVISELGVRRNRYYGYTP